VNPAVFAALVLVVKSGHYLVAFLRARATMQIGQVQFRKGAAANI
jgi:hypothetical protein